MPFSMVDVPYIPSGNAQVFKSVYILTYTYYFMFSFQLLFKQCDIIVRAWMVALKPGLAAYWL